MVSDKKIVEIICVGTEILLGNIVNTNARYLSEKCAELGLACYYQSVVGDNAERLEGVVSQAVNRSDVVILSGGLGPTDDDLTKETVCKVLNVPMYCHEETKAKLISFFERRNISITENNFKQAMMPEDGIILTNNNGTAPGVIICKDNKHIVLLPGPPEELIPMFEESVKPYLNELTNEIFVSQTVKLVSVGESAAETMIKDLIESQSNPTIATYAKIGEVHIRVTAAASDTQSALKLIKPVINELKSRFGNCVYTTHDDVTLEKSIVDLLVSSNLKCMTVESCTGGKIASRIVSVPGASEVIELGLVTYSNKAKRKLTSVKKTTLEKYTAVSEEVVREMVRPDEIGIDADVIVGVTGYAGPATENDDKAGHVFIACNVCGKISVKEFHFSGNRDKVRESATVQALVLMRECILEYLSEKTFG